MLPRCRCCSSSTSATSSRPRSRRSPSGEYGHAARASDARPPRSEAHGFPDYAGKANDYADGVRYFTDKFLRMNKDPERTIFCHVTCATDTSNARLRRVFRGFARGEPRAPQVRAVMDMCYHVITQKNIESFGFM